jgi:two-component system sensor histidine kinase BaeS
MTSQLEQAREAERSVLLSVSHELRTPLTAIRGYAEGVEDGAVDRAEAHRVIAAESARLERLVKDLLALARLEQGVLDVRSEPIDLGEIAADARRRLALAAAGRGVEVSLSQNGASPATGDPDRALQVVSNLIENAIRMTPAGGRVEIEVAPGRVVVADTGPGIAGEDVPHAFERFHLRDRSGADPGEGSGLGLAIVRELTEAMGGSVELTSTPGSGARFTVRLPTA